MPKNCDECFISEWNTFNERFYCPFDDCQLVEVSTPHSRLIEVTDELLTALSNFIAETGIDEAPYMSASDWIEMNAPTVIEGERTNA